MRNLETNPKLKAKSNRIIVMTQQKPKKKTKTGPSGPYLCFLQPTAWSSQAERSEVVREEIVREIKDVD